MVLVAGSVDNKKILLGTCKLICMMIVWNGEIILMSCNVVWVLSYFDTDHIVTSACSLSGTSDCEKIKGAGLRCTCKEFFWP